MTTEEALKQWSQNWPFTRASKELIEAAKKAEKELREPQEAPF